MLFSVLTLLHLAAAYFYQPEVELDGTNEMRDRSHVVLIGLRHWMTYNFVVSCSFAVSISLFLSVSLVSLFHYFIISLFHFLFNNGWISFVWRLLNLQLLSGQRSTIQRLVLLDPSRLFYFFTRFQKFIFLC